MPWSTFPALSPPVAASASKPAALTALCAFAALLLAPTPVTAFDRPETIFKIFQFPADKIPRIDGDATDWALVPDSYAVTHEQLTDDSSRKQKPDAKNLDVRVRVGWVKGLNRLYFLYEASDNYWDFSRTDLHNDTFEIVVDGDASGGPLIDRQHPHKDTLPAADTYFPFHGVHAQNYHIFTPFVGKDWCLAWGSQPWIKELPWANAAQNFTFKPGESGRYVLEFWITPFDYAGPEGPARAVESVLREDKLIGLSWAVIDYDDVNARGSSAFWNLSGKHTMYGNASELRAFRLMPLEPALAPKLDARWSFKVLDHARRLPRRVRRPDHRVEMGLRRRRVVDRAAPAAHLQKVRQVHRRAPRHRTRRHLAPCENLGRRPPLTPERPLGLGFVSSVTPSLAKFRCECQEPAGFRATFHFPLAAPSVVVLS